MHFEGEFSVPGKPADVIRRFADVPRMSACMPGAVLEPQAEDGSWPGGMVVSFGPKKIKFKGKATVDFDFEALTGSVHGRGTADMRAARIGVKVSFALRDDPESPKPATIVKIVSDAELGGVLADFARTGGIAVANVIMADFARRAAEEFSKDEAPAEIEAVAEPPATPAVADTETTDRPAGPSPTAPIAAPAEPPPPRPRPTPQPAAPLAAHSLLWVVIKAYLARIGRFFGIGR
jgi:carbon monoxide dehydrogenase subunit G